MAESAEKILIADDDEEIREIVSVLLESEGYETIHASSGEEALKNFSPEISLVILDVMMEGISGYQTCKKIREKSNVPILFLTAKNKDSDLTMGFSSGGDDYLSKPFSYAELLARVKGLLRRYKVYSGTGIDEERQIFEWDNIRIDEKKTQAWLMGEELTLTDKEFQILALMLKYHGKIFSAENLYESIWEEPFFFTSANTVMVHIRRLREKVEDDPQNPRIIKTVWGKGYRID